MKEVYKELSISDKYLCSNFGNIKSKRFGKILKGQKNSCGYLRVQISYAGNRYFIHRLVADTFVKKIKGKNFVNHKDGNKQNNLASNLEWVTRSENDLHAFKIGLRVPYIKNKI